MELLKKMPFYGDIIMRVPFVRNSSIPTARTDGGKIEYNPAFLLSMSEKNRNYVLMHEIFHIILRHCNRGSEKNLQIWNTAADMIVNNMLDRLKNDMQHARIPFERPSDAITGFVQPTDTMENVYSRLVSLNGHLGRHPKKIAVPSGYGGARVSEVPIPQDIAERIAASAGSVSQPDMTAGELIINQIVREAALKHRSETGSYYIPDQVYGITQSKLLNWKKLLKNFLFEEIGDDVSYTTPERKYIHMDLILPGHSLSDGGVEEIWAFVDSSGSIGKDEMEQFLTQLCRISKEFKCTFNICYWDTKVTDIYKKVTSEADILKSLPHHSGGTDINCVYAWIKENRVKPDVMLVLTDGYFGRLNQEYFSPSLRKKTILVLSNSNITPEMKLMGQTASLE